MHVYSYEFSSLQVYGYEFSGFMGMKFSKFMGCYDILGLWGCYKFFFLGIFWVVYVMLCCELVISCSCICKSALDDSRRLWLGYDFLLLEEQIESLLL